MIMHRSQLSVIMWCLNKRKESWMLDVIVEESHSKTATMFNVIIRCAVYWAMWTGQCQFLLWDTKTTFARMGGKKSRASRAASVSKQQTFDTRITSDWRITLNRCNELVFINIFSWREFCDFINFFLSPTFNSDTILFHPLLPPCLCPDSSLCSAQCPISPHGSISIRPVSLSITDRPGRRSDTHL